MTAATTTDTAELPGRVSEARAELAALLEKVRALATALDHAPVPATAENAAVDVTHYLHETALRLGGAETMLDEAVRAARGLTGPGVTTRSRRPIRTLTAADPTVVDRRGRRPGDAQTSGKTT